MKNIPVGKTIALLAEEGDDISNLEVPADEPASSPKPSQPEPTAQPSSSASSQPTPAAVRNTSAPPQTHHEIPKTSRPLFPSVLRLIQEHGITQGDVDKIKGTGVRGMLTKGDVLTHLGLASAPLGTYRETPAPDPKTDAKTGAKQEQAAALDGAAIRRLIVGNMLEASIKARAAAGEFVLFDPLRGRRFMDCRSSERNRGLRLRYRGLPSATPEEVLTSCSRACALEASGCQPLGRSLVVYSHLGDHIDGYDLCSIAWLLPYMLQKRGKSTIDTWQQQIEACASTGERKVV